MSSGLGFQVVRPPWTPPTLESRKTPRFGPLSVGERRCEPLPRNRLGAPGLARQSTNVSNFASIINVDAHLLELALTNQVCPSHAERRDSDELIGLWFRLCDCVVITVSQPLATVNSRYRHGEGTMLQGHLIPILHDECIDI